MAWPARPADARGFERALDGVFPGLESVSVDYAVLEHAPDTLVLEAAFDWDDLGSWGAWARRQPRDEHGNVLFGDAVAVDCRGCIVVGEGGTAAALGLEDMVVVHVDGSTLACRLEETDRVRLGERGGAPAGAAVSRGAGGRALALAAGAALALAGCAGPALAARPPRRRRPRLRPRRRTAAAPPVLAVPDTVPSADALAVLAGIPEPIRAEEGAAAPVTASPARAPPPGPRPGPRTREAAGRTCPCRPGRPCSASGRCPTSSPRPRRRPRPPGRAAPAGGGCRTRHLLARAARGVGRPGEGRAATSSPARSQLAVPLAIEEEAGLFKVRTSGCLDGAAADALRGRAREAGFEGAFRFRGGKP